MKIEPRGDRVLICITGGIAAYKVCEVISTLGKSGIEVKVVLTSGAQAFITPLTVSTLSRNPAYTDADFWHVGRGQPLHIELAEWADLLVIAPLTANTLAKLVWGMADNLLTNTVLASTCPILLAPAMNTDMWEQQTVQRNWQQIQADPRYHMLHPGSGVLACDRIGTGRMVEPAQILTHIDSLLHTHGQRDLSGKRILISAGGTRESLDPVRFIGNPSTGKMGVALAQAAAHRGGIVTFVCGPIDDRELATLPPMPIRTVTTAEQMQQVLLAEFAQTDWLVMSAAVADVKPADYSGQKLPKKALPTSLPLAFVPDIAAELGKRKQPHQRAIGFAAQTGDIVTPALEKLHAKHFDAIVANPIDLPGAGFGSPTNQAILISASGKQEAIDSCSKLKLAHHIFDFCSHL